VELNSADPEVIGRYIIDVFQKSRPANDSFAERKIGSLYGFDLYVRSLKRASSSDTLFSFQNDLYAQNSQTGIKYLYNSGAPNVDNPKLAARYFLNAIDRVDHLIEHHYSEVLNAEKQIPELKKLVEVPFEKENELQQMRLELSGLERKIALNIQENQIKESQKERTGKVQADKEIEPVDERFVIGPPDDELPAKTHEDEVHSSTTVAVQKRLVKRELIASGEQGGKLKRK
jgi:hypothetical protein